MRMHFVPESSRRSKIYSMKPYAIPINNDRSHQGLSQECVKEQKIVHEKKQIEKIMHGVIKQRMFGNFMRDETKVSDENYMKIEGINKDQWSRRINTHRTHRISTHRTIDASDVMRKTSGRDMYTIDVSQMMTTNYNARGFSKPQSKVSRRLDISKLPSLRSNQRDRNFGGHSPERTFGLTTTHLERTSTKEVKTQKIYVPLFHTKKLELNQKTFTQFYRKLAGAQPKEIIYEVSLTREMLYNRYKSVIEPKYLQRFFHFFGFPMSFGIRQFMQLLENASNCNLRFVYFWVFVLLDDNGNGVLTNQDLFRVVQTFKDNQYIEQQVYELVRFIEHPSRNKELDGEPPALQALTANRNLRMDELKELLRQTTKERIDVNCVKNTCYHQTIISLEHNHGEREKLNDLESAQAETKLLKERVMERKLKLENQPKLRFRDFFVIFNSRRPKIYCFILKLLADVVPEDYE